MSFELGQTVSIVYNDKYIDGNIVGMSNTGYTISLNNGNTVYDVPENIIIPYANEKDLQDLLDSSDDEEEKMQPKMPIKMPVKKKTEKPPLAGTFASRKYNPNTTVYDPLNIISKGSPKKGGGRKRKRRRGVSAIRTRAISIWQGW